MNKKYKQSGFAHMGILVIVLVVALIGTLGFVFYQNFIEKNNDSVTKTEANTDSIKNTDSPKSDSTFDASNTIAEDPNKGYVVLSEWGVRFKNPTDLGSNQIKYQKSGGVYQFTTSDVESIGANCTLTNYPLGVISRYSANTPEYAGKLASKIGDYSYYVNNAMAVCSDSSTNIQTRDLNIVKNMLLSVEKS